MNRKLLLTALFIITAAVLYSEGGINPGDDNLRGLIGALKTESRAYRANEVYRDSGILMHEAAMSGYHLMLDAKVKSTGGDSFRTTTAEGYEVINNYSAAASPELSFSQLLPSNGTLSGSVSDSISGSGIESSTYPLYPASDLTLSNTLTMTLGVSQPLYFDDAYGASLNAAEGELELSRINYHNNKNNLVVSAAEDYYNLIKYKYQSELVRKRLDTNTESFRRLEKEYQLGLRTLSQLNNARAAKLQAEADLLKSEQAYSSAIDLVSAFYGLPEVDRRISAENGISSLLFDETDSGKLIESLNLSNPDIMLLLKKIENAESDLVIEKGRNAAVLSAGGTYKMTHGITEDTFSDNLSFSIGLSAPVSDGGASEAKIKLKQSELERLQNELEDRRVRAASELELYFNNILIGEKLFEIYSLQEETGRLEYEKGLKEFELGGISQKDLLDLQISLEDVRLTLMINRIDTNISILKLYRLLGHDLESMLLN